MSETFGSVYFDNDDSFIVMEEGGGGGHFKAVEIYHKM
jgi:hypothetical protein